MSELEQIENDAAALKKYIGRWPYAVPIPYPQFNTLIDLITRLTAVVRNEIDKPLTDSHG